MTGKGKELRLGSVDFLVERGITATNTLAGESVGVERRGRPGERRWKNTGSDCQKRDDQDPHTFRYVQKIKEHLPANPLTHLKLHSSPSVAPFVNI